ncbi:MAG: GNAT family N-acetyltransferase [Candidatus Nanopelagicales bacterium]|jgi:ribosomal protein S18 acetylase RimI-like enzyme
MPHPLLLARPTDPFLRLRVEDPERIEAYAIDGDHVAFLRRGHRVQETWVSALGDDSTRIIGLIEELCSRGIDGVHVHDHVFPDLPAHLRGPDPGHWSLWEFTADCVTPTAEELAVLSAEDPRIDALLAHSDSAYIRTDDVRVTEWLGVLDGEDLVAVGGRLPGAAKTAHLVSICTHPRVRGRGLAGQVTASLVHRAQDTGAEGVWLEMYADNSAAAAVYRRVGFTEAGRYRSALL